MRPKSIAIAIFIFLMLFSVNQPNAEAFNYSANFDDYYMCLSSADNTLYTHTLDRCKEYKAKGADGKLAEYAGCLYWKIYTQNTTLFSYVISGCAKYKPKNVSVGEYNYSACMAHNTSTLYSQRLASCKKYRV